MLHREAECSAPNSPLERGVSTPPTLAWGNGRRNLGEATVLVHERAAWPAGGKLYTGTPMVSASGSRPPVNPWVSVVPSLVCKPLVTAARASA